MRARGDRSEPDRLLRGRQVFTLKHQVRFHEEREAAARGSSGGGGGGGGDYRERPRPGPPPRFGKHADAPPGFGGFPQDFYPHHAALPGHPGTGRSGNGGDAGVPMGGGGSGDRKRGAPPRDRSSYGSGGKRPR